MPQDTRLKFPLKQDEDNRSKITFQVVKLIPPSVTNNGQTVGGQPLGTAFSGMRSFMDGSGGQPTNFDEVGQSLAEEQASQVGSLAAAERAKPPFNINVENNAGLTGGQINYLNERVTLYMPAAYTVNDTVGYSNADLGVGGATAEQAILRTQGNVRQALAAGAKQGLNAASDFARSVSSGTFSQAMAARMLNNNRTGSGLGAAVASAARVRANPNLRTMFTGVNVRNFSFNFKLIPVSGAESNSIREIIKLFRVNMYPEAIQAGNGGGVDLGYRFPNLFQIKLSTRDSNNRFKTIGTPIKLCYLQSLSSNYNPSAPMFHEDGSPVEIDIALNFTEHRALNRQDILAEGDPAYHSVEGYRPTETSVEFND